MEKETVSTIRNTIRNLGNKKTEELRLYLVTNEFGEPIYVNMKRVDIYIKEYEKLSINFDRHNYFEYIINMIRHKDCYLQNKSKHINNILYHLMKMFNTNKYPQLDRTFVTTIIGQQNSSYILNKVRDVYKFYSILKSNITSSVYKNFTYKAYMFIENIENEKDIINTYNEKFEYYCGTHDDRLFKYLLDKTTNIDLSKVFINIISDGYNDSRNKYILKRIKLLNEKYKVTFSLIIKYLKKTSLYNSVNVLLFVKLFKIYYNEPITYNYINSIVTHYYDKTDSLKMIYNLLKTEKEKNLLNLSFFQNSSTLLVSSLYNHKLDEDYNNVLYSCFFLNDTYDQNVMIMRIKVLQYIINIFGKDDVTNCIVNSINNSPDYQFYGIIKPQYLFMLNVYILYQKLNKKKIHIQISKHMKKYSTMKIFTRYCCSYVREKKNVKIFPILNELRNLKPNDIIPVFRDGTRFYKNTNYHFNFIPPYSLYPGGLDVIRTQCFIKEKADGTLVYNIDDFQQSIKAEYIEDEDIYLVFDIDLDMSIQERYEYLRSIHPLTKNTTTPIINNKDDLLKAITMERELYQQFLSTKHLKWYPKCSYYVEDINCIKDYLYSVVNSDTDEFVENNGMNDGYILTPLNGDREIKLKPKSLLTIDLLYKNKKFVDREGYKYKIKCNIKPINNMIYRCYPIDGEYVATEVRFDKKKPNNESVVNTLMNLYKVDYTVKNQLYFTQDNYTTNYEWGKIVRSNNNMIKKIITYMNRGLNILDLGCGKGKLLNFNIEYSKYYGVDFDNIQLNIGYNKFNDKNAIFNYLDLTDDWNSTPNKWMKFKYIEYSNIFAINSLMHFNTELFWKQVTDCSDTGTRFAFNLMNQKVTDYKFDCGYITVDNDIVKYKFNPVHKNEMTEKYVDINDVKPFLEKYEWTIENEFTNDGVLTSLYSWYIIRKN